MDRPCFDYHWDSAYFVAGSKILAWINSTLHLNLSKVEDGLHSVHHIDDLNFDVRNNNEMIQNYNVLQDFTNKMKITKCFGDEHIEVNRLIKGRTLDNLEFMQWMRRWMRHYCDCHNGGLINSFANEGHVRERSRWFSSLRDLMRKLKMEHIKLRKMLRRLGSTLQRCRVSDVLFSLQVDQNNQLHEDIKMKFLQEVRERNAYYNKVLELKGNIRVFCRWRPLNTDEIDGGVPMAVDFKAAKDGELTVRSNGISKRAFKFVAVFSPAADQLDVSEETSPLAISVVDGYNVCIFAYGQTETGRNFTMEGTDEVRGVTYRTLQRLFNIIEEFRRPLISKLQRMAN
ncbi:hypothetical protein OROHE_005548 [Orobanche hederae]